MKPGDRRRDRLLPGRRPAPEPRSGSSRCVRGRRRGRGGGAPGRRRCRGDGGGEVDGDRRHLGDRVRGGELDAVVAQGGDGGQDRARRGSRAACQGDLGGVLAASGVGLESPVGEHRVRERPMGPVGSARDPGPVVVPQVAPLPPVQGRATTMCERRRRHRGHQAAEVCRWHGPRGGLEIVGQPEGRVAEHLVLARHVTVEGPGRHGQPVGDVLHAGRVVAAAGELLCRDQRDLGTS